MEKKNNQPIRILKDFKRKNQNYYYVYETDDLNYVLISDYSHYANRIGVRHKSVLQLDDIRFSVEKEDSQAFISALESYGIKRDIKALNKWADRRNIDTSSREQVELWITDVDDSEIPF